MKKIFLKFYLWEKHFQLIRFTGDVSSHTNILHLKNVEFILQWGVYALDAGEICDRVIRAPSQSVAVTCKVIYSCSFWPFNGHLLLIKCVPACEGGHVLLFSWKPYTCGVRQLCGDRSASVRVLAGLWRVCVCVCVFYVFSPPSGGQHHTGLAASTHSSIPHLV